jgi:hypothetical protein
VVYEKFLPIVKLLAKAKLSKQTTLYDIAFRGAFMLHGFLRKHLPATIKEPLFKMLKA